MFGKNFRRSADAAACLLPREPSPIFRMSLPWQKNHQIRVHGIYLATCSKAKLFPTAYSQVLWCCLILNDSASTFFFSFLLPGVALSDLESAALLFLMFTGGHDFSPLE